MFFGVRRGQYRTCIRWGSGEETIWLVNQGNSYRTDYIEAEKVEWRLRSDRIQMIHRVLMHKHPLWRFHPHGGEFYARRKISVEAFSNNDAWQFCKVVHPGATSNRSYDLHMTYIWLLWADWPISNTFVLAYLRLIVRFTGYNAGDEFSASEIFI